MRENTIEPEATDINIIQHMRIESWIPKATNSHTEYIKFIAFSPQQQLQRYIIRTLRLLLHINQVNKESIRIPLFPLYHHLQCNYIFPK